MKKKKNHNITDHILFTSFFLNSCNNKMLVHFYFYLNKNMLTNKVPKTSIKIENYIYISICEITNIFSPYHIKSNLCRFLYNEGTQSIIMHHHAFNFRPSLMDKFYQLMSLLNPLNMNFT